MGKKGGGGNEWEKVERIKKNKERRDKLKMKK